MAIDQQAFRITMRQWVTGVTIVTSASAAQRAGMTVSSFISVSLEPPTVLVCLNKSSYAHEIVHQSGNYAVSLLALGQEALSQRFAGLEPGVTDRFDSLEWTTAQTGAPLLMGAAAWLDCRVLAEHDAYTHTIYVGEVVFAQVNADLAPLAYHNREYHRIVPND